MQVTDRLERGREAYARCAWRDAHDELCTADDRVPLEASDLEQLGMAAYLIGRDETALEGFERAHRAYLLGGEVARAVRCAYWLGRISAGHGRHAEGRGWLARAQRLLDEESLDCVERGLLLIPPALQALYGGRAEEAYSRCGEVLTLAERFGDPELLAMSQLVRGHALVLMGEAERGLSLLDEVMLAVTTGDVSPVFTGIAYCGAIIACRRVFDLGRAQEWTGALSRWCAAQPDLKLYRGQCLIHRSEIMQLHGEWSEALAEVGEACAHLAELRGDPVLGMAHYQQAELLRLRGSFTEAEQAYREASELGHPVHPGLALLRAAQGRLEDAVAAIRRVMDEAEDDRVQRSRVLAAFAEIMLAAGDTEAVRLATDELDQLARDFRAPYLRALAATVRGSLLLSDADARAAYAALRRAWLTWQELDAPYEAAHARLLMSQACRDMGDHDTANMELDAARKVFEQLSAGPALARAAQLSAAQLSAGQAARTPGGLTRREIDVLKRVATGATNREVAGSLFISEKTVARHLSNIFTKLDISSRAAATAYAYQHDLA